MLYLVKEQHVDDAASVLAKHLQGVDAIVGVAKGGLIPAQKVADILDVPMYATVKGKVPKRAVKLSLGVVDDDIESGDTMNSIVGQCGGSGAALVEMGYTDYFGVWKAGGYYAFPWLDKNEDVFRRTLFLEDNPRRIAAIRKDVPGSIVTSTPEQFEREFNKGLEDEDKLWQFVSLDHDLYESDPTEQITGMDVVRFLCGFRRLPVAGKVIVHTANETARERMVERLSKHGYSVVIAQMSDDGFTDAWRPG